MGHPAIGWVKFFPALAYQALPFLKTEQILHNFRAYLVNGREGYSLVSLLLSGQDPPRVLQLQGAHGGGRINQEDAPE